MVYNINFIYIILSILFQALSAIFGKSAAISLQAASIYGVLTNTFYILSLVCLLLQAIVWQQALVHYPLSYAYPFNSLVNFVVLIVSALIFHEGITITNILGLIMISIGITIIAQKTKGCNNI